MRSVSAIWTLLKGVSP